MSKAVHILGSARPRPRSSATIFCDGSADDTFRPGIDVELSHWIPNRTPGEFRADTSTETCLRFAESGELDRYDLVVNNHVDVDGVLSVFAIVRPEMALRHRDAVVEAAEMGDFWAYGSGVALAIFETLTAIAAREDEDVTAVYEECLGHVAALLSGEVPGPGVEAARGILAESVDLVESGRVRRTMVSPRLVSYEIPSDVAERDLAAALHVPGFNAPLTRDTMLLPQARNLHDRERVQLVSVETSRGWHHDLWYPGYMWADTENVWRAPGFSFADSTNAWFFGFPRLTAAVEELDRRDGAGEWTIAQRLLPFRTLPGRNFPVVVTHLGPDHAPGPSRLPPGDVAAVLAPAFADA